jgi:hypothetical protein
MFITKRLSSVALCLAVATATEYSLDWNTAPDCAARVDECRSSQITFLECPATCVESLDGGLMVQGIAPRENSEFFKLKSKTPDGEVVHFYRMDDFVTVIAVLPSLPGMAQYYYDVTEYLANKYPYMVSTVVLPFEKTNDRSFDSINLDIWNHGKATVLETHVADSLGSHPIVKYVESARRNQNEPDPLFDDRVIFFVVSHDGRYIERRVCPTKEKLNLVVQHYLEYQEEKTSQS